MPEIIADAAYHCARTAGVVALAVGTTSGSSARLLARYRPPVPIYAFTSNEKWRASFRSFTEWKRLSRQT